MRIGPYEVLDVVGHGVGAQPSPYLAMPLLTGGTLRDRLRSGPLRIAEAVGLVRALATGRADARTRLGRRAHAIADATMAIAFDPSDAGAWDLRGLARGLSGDLAGEVADCSRALELDPRLASAWRNRGVARQLLRDPRGAISDLDRALALDPTHATAS